MQRSIGYIITGILFGIIMSKSESISWYRIQEMFRFQSFHMYGIIGSAVIGGMIATRLIKRYKLNDLYGQPVRFQDKARSWKRYIFGGTIFGLGWALTGACPGPIFVLLGHGFISILPVIAGALSGTYFYGAVRHRLPH